MAAHPSILAWKIPRMDGSWDRKESDMTERLHFQMGVLDTSRCSPSVNEPSWAQMNHTSGTQTPKLQESSLGYKESGLFLDIQKS